MSSGHLRPWKLSSKYLRRQLDASLKVSELQASVFIQAQTSFAQKIHRNSVRRLKPFSVNIKLQSSWLTWTTKGDFKFVFFHSFHNKVTKLAKQIYRKAFLSFVHGPLSFIVSAVYRVSGCKALTWMRHNLVFPRLFMLALKHTISRRHDINNAWNSYLSLLPLPPVWAP